MRIKVLLVDALNLIRRVYSAQTGEDGPRRTQDALQATVRSLQRALRECRPTHAACIFEGEGASWRHKAYAGYKAGRAPMPQALRSGLPKFEEAFFGLGVVSQKVPALEADDVIATAAAKVASHKGKVVILSTDKLFYQLLSGYVTVRNHFERRDMDQAYVMERFGVEPGQLVDLLAFTGDSTNNVPGVPTVGVKTAARLLSEFGTLDNVLSATETIGGKLGNTLQEHAEEARRAQSLVRLRTDVPLGMNLKSWRYRHQGSMP